MQLIYAVVPHRTQLHWRPRLAATANLPSVVIHRLHSLESEIPIFHLISGNYEQVTIRKPFATHRPSPTYIFIDCGDLLSKYDIQENNFQAIGIWGFGIRAFRIWNIRIQIFGICYFRIRVFEFHFLDLQSILQNYLIVYQLNGRMYKYSAMGKIFAKSNPRFFAKNQ